LILNLGLDCIRQRRGAFDVFAHVVAGPFKVGDTVDYSYTVTDTGNTELHNVMVRDNLAAEVACEATALAPGQSTTCHGRHTITKADVTPCKKAKERGGCIDHERC
jgi:uncharacterized repeat protein (TIGR01451 family)